MAKKQTFKQGEKILFGITGAFIVLATLGYVALEAVRLTSPTPMFESKTSYDLSPEGREGSRIFRVSQCTACHRAMRNGTNMGLSLDGVGTKRDVEWLEAFLRKPEETYGATTIDHGFRPKEAAYVMEMSDDELSKLAIFLSELKAEQGSSSSPIPPEGRSDFIDGMVKVFAPDDWKEKYRDIRTDTQVVGEEQ